MANLLSYAFILFFLCALALSLVEAQSGGFSVELIHRDSPKSPYYNPNETPYQRLRNALSRSVNRGNHLNQNFTTSKTAQADIIPNPGEYLIRISIGTPPVEILAVADTGSDLIWTQCKPCPPSQCYKQDAPFFDPLKSSTYKSLSCSSSQCASLDKRSCSTDGNCKYSISYGDRSFSNGNLATETITLSSTTGQAVPLPATVFGCGTNNNGIFSSKTTGIVGLGGGDVSLISQLKTTIAGKFSYCLVPQSSTKINFGTNAVVSGAGVVSTPLTVSKTYYVLTLEAISVGDQRLGVVSGSTPGGGIIIDSGTTLTYLPQGYNSKLLSIISNKIGAQPVADPKGTFDLCFRINSISQVPKITVHFKGADVELKTYNYLAKISDDIVCSVFNSGNNALYGNIMQTNFLVGYDIEQQVVSFKPTDCTQQ